jgi:hypothetical protein
MLFDDNFPNRLCSRSIVFQQANAFLITKVRFAARAQIPPSTACRFPFILLDLQHLWLPGDTFAIF